MGLADIARHVIGCHLIKKPRLKNTLEYMADAGPGR